MSISGNRYTLSPSVGTLLLTVALLTSCAAPPGQHKASKAELSLGLVNGLPPSTALLYIPAHTRVLVTNIRRYNTAQEVSLIFFDANRRINQQADLVAQLPPGCLDEEPESDTYPVGAWDIFNRVYVQITITQQPDPRYFNVAVADLSGVLLATASLGVPTTPSSYCKELP